MTVGLRTECADDELFLRRLILETVAVELGASAWPEPMRSHLLGVQCAGRRHAHRADFPSARSRVIEADGADSGWILVNAMPHEIRLVEIMVLEEMRGRGIGTLAIREVFGEAEESGRTVRLTVNVTNAAAIRLYERLGFRRVEGDEVQDVMEWTGAHLQNSPTSISLPLPHGRGSENADESTPFTAP